MTKQHLHLMRKRLNVALSQGNLIKTGHELAHHMGLRSDAEVRRVVNYARKCGDLIASDQDGYWLGGPKSMEKTVKHLTGRMNAIRRAIYGLRRSMVEQGMV